MIDAKLGAKAVIAVERLFELAGHTNIVKHTPGQIQLKIKPTGLLIALRIKLEEFAELKAYVKGIVDARADKSARTVTIDYDEKVIPKELWELLVRSNSNPKVRKLVEKEIFNRVLSGLELPKTGTDS